MFAFANTYSHAFQGREKDTKVSIYKKSEENYMLKLKASRALLAEVKTKYGNMPFNIRSFEEETKARMGVVECVSHKMIEPFQVLYEKPCKSSIPLCTEIPFFFFARIIGKT